MPPRSPVFLERGSYRQRRVMDAVRLVAILGAGLWMIPLLWPSGDDGVRMSRALMYVFGVWAVLIGLSLVLSRRVRRQPDATGDIEDI
ncbi:hypothetical protein [Roseobacter sp.]|uniref:hypothetical protein n=1 Tax=Roseobacter sp. TaxID=1907202 RepID=UPI003296CAA7